MIQKVIQKACWNCIISGGLLSTESHAKYIVLTHLQVTIDESVHLPLDARAGRHLPPPLRHRSPRHPKAPRKVGLGHARNHQSELKQGSFVHVEGYIRCGFRCKLPSMIIRIG